MTVVCIKQKWKIHCLLLLFLFVKKHLKFLIFTKKIVQNVEKYDIINRSKDALGFYLEELDHGKKYVKPGSRVYE